MSLSNVKDRTINISSNTENSRSGSGQRNPRRRRPRRNRNRKSNNPPPPAPGNRSTNVSSDMVPARNSNKPTRNPIRSYSINDPLYMSNVYMSRKLAELTQRHYPNVVLEVIKSMMLPSEYGACRYPGNSHTPTSLGFTKREISISVNFDEDGRFSVAFHPGLGSSGTSPIPWQTSLVDTENGFPDNLTLASSFVEGAPGAMGGDYRLDPQSSFYTQPINGQNTGTWMSQWQISVAPYTNPFNGTETELIANSGLYPVLTPAPGGGASEHLSLPVGQYLMTIWMLGPSGGTVPVGLSVTGQGRATVTTKYAYNYDPTSTADRPATMQALELTVYTNTDYFNMIGGYINATAEMVISITPGYFPNSSPEIPLNGGFIQKIRPVGMSVTLSNTLAGMYTGGSIAANLVDNQTLQQKYFVNGAENSLAMWEKLVQIQGRPTFQGSVTKGVHAFWVPLTFEQTNFVSPDEMATIGYPQLVISGQYTNAANLTGNQVVMRGEIIHCYEYVTNNLGVSSLPVQGSNTLVDKVISAFDGSPIACENPTHKSKVSNFINKLGNVVGTVDGIIKTGAKMLPMFGF